MSQNKSLATIDGEKLGKEPTLAINEIFYSIQGESTQAGRPTTFVRLMGCPLRCSYCDTEYAFFEGKKHSFTDLLGQIRANPTNLVEITGGEPMAQPRVVPFMQLLVDEGFEVMIETSGAFTLADVPREVRIIMDVKTPGSKEVSKMHWDNFGYLKPGIDEVKFVICSKEDFDFALEVAEAHNLFAKYAVLISPSFGQVKNLDLANWVLESAKPWRMQLQMHKYVWHPEERGV
ncbi:radical SAM protein [bacterium]|nr:radical SAM protein [bacterium]